MTDPAPQREAILTALERLLAWPEMSRSPQLGRFLDYIVQRTLEGNEQSIKAYSIAVDVFGRPPDFDPQADPIVRVQARRLRALLHDYYRGPGGNDVIQIRLPVGRYIPEFTVVPDAGERVADADMPVASVLPSERGRRFAAAWFALAGIALGLAIAAFAFAEWRPDVADAIQRPTITIVEFQRLPGEDAAQPQVAGLALELVTDLEQFGNIDVLYGGGGEAIATTDVPMSDYVLTGIVRPDGQLVQYSAILTDNRTRMVVWDQVLPIPAGDAMGPNVLDSVSKSLSLVLGSPRGPLHAGARQFLASGAPLERELSPYICRVLFDLYRETGGASEAGRANDCFLALPEADRESAVALAATASLLAEQPDVVMGGDRAPDERYGLAAAYLGRAIELDPLSGFVWEQQARLHEATGALDQARADFRSSVQLNPASVDALAAFARLLALSGNLAEAEAMARDAVEHSPAPPPWYHGVPALLALRDGDLDKAIASAERYAEADRELGPILAIMAAQQSGDSAVVNRYLPQILDVASFRTGGVMPRLRQRVTDDGLMYSMRLALLEAGIPPAALSQSF